MMQTTPVNRASPAGLSSTQHENNTLAHSTGSECSGRCSFASCLMKTIGRAHQNEPRPISAVGHCSSCVPGPAYLPAPPPLPYQRPPISTMNDLSQSLQQVPQYQQGSDPYIVRLHAPDECSLHTNHRSPKPIQANRFNCTAIVAFSVPSHLQLLHQLQCQPSCQLYCYCCFSLLQL